MGVDENKRDKLKTKPNLYLSQNDIVIETKDLVSVLI